MTCQSCRSSTTLVFSAGDLPPCNDYIPIGEPREQTHYPTDLYFCKACGLAQLGFVPPQSVTFPASYPYTSSTTKALRDNFAQLYEETQRINPLGPDDLVIDIGGNDGNLLSNWVGKHRVLNVTPEATGLESVHRGAAWSQSYWTTATARDLVLQFDRAKLITATNVFAHVPDPHDFLDGVDVALAPGGMFVSESHYLPDLLRSGQYDTIYGEHARYLSLQSIRHQLSAHNFTIIGARSIPTHGGSIRVYAMREGERLTGPLPSFVLGSSAIEDEEPVTLSDFATFRERVAKHRHDLRRLLGECRSLGLKVAGLGAPSRASTLVSYCGLSTDDLDCVYESPNSHKLHKYMPGTRIEIRPEPEVFSDGYPDVLLLLSHHVGEQLSEAVKLKGCRGKFIWPLPEVRVE